MITHNSDYGNEDMIHIEESQNAIAVETEQSEFKKLPQLDSFDSMTDEAIGKNEPFRMGNQNQQEVA